MQLSDDNERRVKGNTMPMDYNEHKYWIESSDLTEAEKIRFARDLIELERQGILEYRDGRWQLAAPVEIDETTEGPVARFRKTEGAVRDQSDASSTTNSGEPSETRVPPLAKAAQPLSEGSSSPDSDDEVSKQ
jgi:hypothetical protein